MSTEVIVYQQRHEWCIYVTYFFATVIYRKFSHYDVFYRFNGENIYVMLEFNITVYFRLEKYCQNYIENTNIDILFSVKYEKIKFLVIALRDSIEIYAWAPKPYHKFMAFKVIHSSWS